MNALQLTHPAGQSATDLTAQIPRNPDSDLMGSWLGALRNLRDSLLVNLAPEIGIVLPAPNSADFWIVIHRLRYQTVELDDATRDASQFWLLTHAGIQLPPIGARGACSTQEWRQ